MHNDNHVNDMITKATRMTAAQLMRQAKKKGLISPVAAYEKAS